MKKKIKKLKPAKCISDRINGIATWRITGPSKDTGERVTVEFFGTREQAEQVELRVAL